MIFTFNVTKKELIVISMDLWDIKEQDSKDSLLHQKLALVSTSAISTKEKSIMSLAFHLK